MLQRLRKKGILRFGAFLSSNVVQKSGQLLLLAGLVYVGTTSDVYRFGLYISLLNLLVPVLALNIHTAVGRISFDIPDDKGRRDFALSSLAAGLGAVAGGCLLIGLGGWLLGFRDELTGGRAGTYALVFAGMLAYTLFQFLTVALRLDDRARPFVNFGLITGIGALAVSAIAFLVGTPPFVAAVAGYSGAQLIAAFYAFAFVGVPVKGGSFAATHMRSAYAYSLGTVLYSVVQWVTNYSGRWLAADWLDDADLAAYILLTQFLVALTLSLTTLYESKRPVILRAFAAGDIPGGISKIDRSFWPSLGLVAAAFAGLLVVFPFLPLILPEEYEFRPTWIGTAAFQCGAYALSIRTYWLAVGLHRTKTFAMAAVAGAAINIGGTLALGPIIGVDGMLLAAGSGLLAQAALARLLMLRRIQR
jgi:hypothetical protein